ESRGYVRVKRAFKTGARARARPRTGVAKHGTNAAPGGQEPCTAHDGCGATAHLRVLTRVASPPCPTLCETALSGTWPAYQDAGGGRPQRAAARTSSEGTMRRHWIFAVALLCTSQAQPLHAETQTWFGFQVGVNGGAPPPPVQFGAAPHYVTVNDVFVVDDPRCDDDVFRA